MARNKVQQIFQRLISAMSRNQKDNALASAQSKLQKEIGKIFINQGKIFIEQFDVFEGRFTESMRLVETIGGDELNRMFANTEVLTNDQFINPLNEAYTASIAAGAQAITAELGEDIISFNLSNQRAEDWMLSNGSKMITQVNETSRHQIKTVVRNGLKAGDSYNTIASAITKRYKEFAIGKPQLHIRSRAHLVAITETGNAYEAGAREGALQANSAGLTMEKRWSDTGDNKVSELCLVNNNESWIGIDQPHASGHQSPLRFPGCRCAELYRRKKGFAPLEKDISVPQLISKSKQAGPGLQGTAETIAARFKSITTPLNLKKEPSIIRKLAADNGIPSDIKDAVRTTIVAPKSQISKIIAEYENAGLSARVKRQAFDNGYTGTIINVHTDFGILGEVQVNTPRMIYAKEKRALQILGPKKYNAIKKATGLPSGKGHTFYEELRVLEAKANKTQKEIKRMNEVFNESKEYYSHFQ